MLTRRFNLNFICLTVVIAVVAGILTPTAKADNRSKPTHRILKSASEFDYPPFALVRPDGSADGFSVDLLKAVTLAVGLEINFSVGPWNKIKQKLVDGHLDVLPLVSYSQEREKVYDFTVPYLRMHGTIFVRKGEKSIRGQADLKDKEVMVMRGDTAHEYAVRENLSDKLILTASFEEAMRMLSKGKHDAVIIQQLVGLQLIKKLGISNLINVSTVQETSVKPVDKPLSGFEQKFCIAVQDGDNELLALLNEGLALVIANGTFDELYRKWFSPILPQPPVPLILILKYLLFILVPTLLLMGIVGLWYLKREVEQRTQSLKNEIKNRKTVEEELSNLNLELEDRVNQRTEQLKAEIAERIQAEETVKENKELLQKVFDGILDPLIMLTANLEVQLLNRAASEYYYSDQNNILGKPCHQAFKARLEPCIGCRVPNAISGAQSISFEQKGFSGPYEFEKIAIYPIEEENSEPKDFIIRIHDITERKLIERKIIQSEKMASLGVLMASIAHEINNPNNFISFNIPILKDYINEMISIIDEYAAKRPELELCNQTYPEFRQDIFNLLVNIENGSVRIRAFVSNLREYSQYRDIKPRIRVELKDIIEKVLSICHSKIKNSVKSFVKNVPEHLPTLYAEPYTIDQILINFLVNACQAADKKDSWIKLNIIVNDVEQQYLSIEVSDNGCGIDEETQIKIFDPFFTTKSLTEGSGLGLYVCHALAERVEGRIEIESEPGEGSMFRLIIPLKDKKK
jgi:signal transduction histidine kinase/ABC-type amino acid transport substrate-binding protein